MSQKTRLTLLERIRDTTAGESWKEFLAVYEALIFGWLRQQGVSTEDAEDVRQEVMTTVYEKIASFDHNGRAGAFRNWLRKITVNRLHRIWRKRKGETSGKNLAELADELADDRSRLTLIWEAAHNEHVIQHLLRELSQRFHENSIIAFQRVVLKEEPAQQVADSLGMSLGAVRVAQHRVLRALKEQGQGLID